MFAHGLAVLAECVSLFVCAMPGMTKDYMCTFILIVFGMTDLHSSVFRLIREKHKDLAYLY